MAGFQNTRALGNQPEAWDGDSMTSVLDGSAKPRRVGPAPVAASAPRRCGAGAWARGALFALVCLGWESGAWRCGGVAGVAGELVELDSDLASWMHSWMPWKRYNYSTPLAAGHYCPHQHCMRCSAPFEWDPHPYQPCRAVPPPARNRTSQSDTTNDTMQLEVASSHHLFHGLLLCSTAPTVNLSLDSVDVELIKEGGTLFDTEGKVLYPSASSSFLMPVVDASGKRYLEAVEYGVLSDFLADDEYYASTFEYQRYDQFRTWDYTSSIAAGMFGWGSWALQTKREHSRRTVTSNAFCDFKCFCHFTRGRLHCVCLRNVRNFRACAVARERFKLHAALVKIMEAPHAI